MGTLQVPCATEDVSDGFHTFGELYAHRFALFLALAREMGTAWRSRVHADGTSYDGWFLVCLPLPTGDISYHLPLSEWEHTHWMTSYERAPSWDGHTSNDVIERLRLYAFMEHG